MTIALRLPEDLREKLGAVRSAGAITGAGVSAESGIRTYRGEGGLYDDPDEGDRTVEALSGPTILSDPDRTWRVTAGLARQAEDARPGPSHQALAAIESKLERFVLLTQNVDGLHRQAGSRNVIDIHGDIFSTICMSCAKRDLLDRGLLPRLTAAPRCGTCGGVLRPDVVLFGEMLPADKVRRIHEEFHLAAPDLLMIVGTSALFPYITEPVLVARHAGRLTIEINPESTPCTGIVDYSLRGPSGAYLPLIERSLVAKTP
jgi:NAD-dependent deacetylase